MIKPNNATAPDVNIAPISLFLFIVFIHLNQSYTFEKDESGEYYNNEKDPRISHIRKD
jgi:hypothetical protein